MKKILIVCATLLAFPGAASAFEFTFNWDGLKLCTSGQPNTVSNPTLTLKNVPEGTKFIVFRLKDRDVPGYNHGGGTVAYSGQKKIAPGAFKYKSPCPPNGSHRYEWTATARKSKMGGKLGVAKAQRKYPE